MIFFVLWLGMLFSIPSLSVPKWKISQLSMNHQHLGTSLRSHLLFCLRKRFWQPNLPPKPWAFFDSLSWKLFAYKHQRQLWLRKGAPSHCRIFRKSPCRTLRKPNPTQLLSSRFWKNLEHHPFSEVEGQMPLIPTHGHVTVLGLENFDASHSRVWKIYPWLEMGWAS